MEDFDFDKFIEWCVAEEDAERELWEELDYWIRKAALVHRRKKQRRSED